MFRSFLAERAVRPANVFIHPSIRSMGGILSLLFVCCLYAGHGFLRRDFTDRREMGTRRRQYPGRF